MHHIIFAIILSDLLVAALILDSVTGFKHSKFSTICKLSVNIKLTDICIKYLVNICAYYLCVFHDFNDHILSAFRILSIGFYVS